MELRNYQIDLVERLRDVASKKGYKKLLIQAPTGAGKTVIASSIMGYAKENGSSVLFLAHRREIIHQTKDKLSKFGLECGVMMSGETPNALEGIQVASIQTLTVRRKTLGEWYLPSADLVIIDEAHRSLSRSYLRMIDYYSKKGAIVLGLTATPIRSDGRGLGHVYEHMEQCPDIGELTDTGYLVPVRYFAPSKPDLEGIKITAGDYNEKQLEERMDKPKLIGDVVENWVRIGQGRQTVVFASGVKHSMNLRDAFCSAGVAAEHLDGKTSKKDRDKILKRLESGKTQVVTNCMVLTEGWDMPIVSCAVFARPTRNPGLYIQMGGRVLRPCEGKKDAVLIDHAGSIFDHGLLNQFTDWTLDDSGKLYDKVQERIKEMGREIVCKECTAIYSGRKMCPECGNEPKSFGKGVLYKDGRLHEINKPLEIPKIASKKVRQDWYSQLLGYATRRGYKRGWVAHNYKDKFGVWPSKMDEIELLATMEVRAFIGKKIYAYRKRNGK